MPALDPGQRVRNLDDVFENMLGEVLRISQGGDAGYINIGEAAGIGKAGAIDVGDAELCAEIFAEIKRQGIHGIAEITTVQVVQKVFTESMRKADAGMLSAGFADTGAAVGSS